MQSRSVTSTSIRTAPLRLLDERTREDAAAIDRSFLGSMGGIGLLMVWVACFGVAFAMRF